MVLQTKLTYHGLIHTPLPTSPCLMVVLSPLTLVTGIDIVDAMSKIPRNIMSYGLNLRSSHSGEGDSHIDGLYIELPKGAVFFSPYFPFLLGRLPRPARH